jgi:RyR domain.
MVQISVDLVARVVHEANRVLQIHAGEVPIGPDYNNAPDWQKESAFEGIHKALAGETAEQLHQSWCEFKIKDGWRFGPVKDEVLKHHPCLVSYSMLPMDQKIKDHMFAAIVQAFKDAPEVEL